MAEAIGLFEAIYTTRSIRRFKPKPIPDDVLRMVLEAALQAPSGANRQPWTWLVVRSPERKKRLHDLLIEGHEKQRAEAEAAGRSVPPTTYLEDLAHIGAVVLVCAPAGGNPQSTTFPAVQNLLLAARAFGLGGNITMGYRQNEAAINQEFGIPEDQTIAAVVPLGYPTGTNGERHGKKTRKALEEVAFEDRWGQAITA